MPHSCRCASYQTTLSFSMSPFNLANSLPSHGLQRVAKARDGPQVGGGDRQLTLAQSAAYKATHASHECLGGTRLRGAPRRHADFRVTPSAEACTPNRWGAGYYKLPLRLASKIITSGPAAKTKSIAANCRTISKFILLPC